MTHKTSANTHHQLIYTTKMQDKQYLSLLLVFLFMSYDQTLLILQGVSARSSRRMTAGIHGAEKKHLTQFCKIYFYAIYALSAKLSLLW